MRVLVCGGRDFTDEEHFASAMKKADVIHGPFHVIIQGECKTGADKMARSWAIYNQADEVGFHADWTKHGRAAGPLRNQRMIDAGKPDLVIAFPGGKGTADMVRRAEAAGVKVVRA